MNDKNLTDILDQIEEEHEFVERAASATLWSAAQGISYGRAMQSSEAKVPALVKALRRAVEMLKWAVEGDAALLAHRERELVGLLIEPEKKQDLEE